MKAEDVQVDFEELKKRKTEKLQRKTLVYQVLG